MSAAPDRGGLLRLALRSTWLSARAGGWGVGAQVCLTIALAALPAMVAWQGKLLLDELSAGRAARMSVVATAAVLGAAFTALAAVGASAGAVLAQRNRLVASAAFESELFHHVNSLAGMRHFEDPAYHNRLRVAQFAAAEGAGEIAICVDQVIRGVVAIISFVGAVLAIWPPLVGFVVVVAAGAMVAQLWLARLNVASIRQRSASERRRAVYQMMLVDQRAAKEIRLYGLGEFFHGRMMRAVRAALKVDISVSRREAIASAVFAIASGAVAAIGTLTVAQRVRAGAATTGDVAFLIAAVAGLQAALSGIVDSFGRASRSARLFADYLGVVDQTPDLVSGGTPAPPLRHGIEFHDVWFRYDDSSPWTLKGVSFTIPAGTAVGLVGLNGAGKSTVVKLLCRFYDPQRGQIRWDGVDLRDLEISSLRRRIGATYQDFMNFDLSAAESIGIGDLQHVTDLHRIKGAARLAGIDDRIDQLPRGYDTMLSRLLHGDEDGERGTALSGGEAQRVALARSMLDDSVELLILDEPSAGLDAIAEHQLHRTLSKRRAGRTTLMISHRLSALRDADQIVTLGDGRVVEAGSHYDLINSDGSYARMFALQAAGYQETSARSPV